VEVLNDLLSAARTGGEAELDKALQRNLDYLDSHFINFLQKCMEDAPTTDDRDELIQMMNKVNLALQERLATADARLRDILSVGDL